MVFAIIAAMMLLSNGSTAKADDPRAEATATIVNQHIVVSVLAAMHFCDKSTWPEDVPALSAYQEAGGIPLPVAPDWPLLASASASYSLQRDELVFVTQEDALPTAHKVTSTNGPPGCDDGDLKVNAGMHIGR